MKLIDVLRQLYVRAAMENLKEFQRDEFGRYVLFAVASWSVSLLGYTFLCGSLFDYKHYLEQWQLMLSGGDPWSTDNTYGPLHNIIGYATLIHPLAPKLLMVGSLLIANFALVLRLLEPTAVSRSFVPYLLAVPTNVLTLGIGLTFGLNDTIVATFLIFATLARLSENRKTTGILIGLAALVKFYPLLLTPFFALDRDRKISWSILMSSGFTFIFGLVGAFLIWGTGFFAAIENGASRGASLMSILTYMQGGGFLEILKNFLVKYNAIIVILTSIFYFAYCLKVRLTWLYAVVIGYLLILMTYKVGHQQFFLPWLFLVSALPLLKEKQSDSLSFAMIPLVIYLAFFHFSFDLGSNLMGNRAEWVESSAGLISFVVELLSVALSFFIVFRGGTKFVQEAVENAK